MSIVRVAALLAPLICPLHALGSPLPGAIGEAADVDAGQPPESAAIDPPAPPGSTAPALGAEGATTVSEGHDLLMTWLEPDESGGRFRFARLSRGTWTRPTTIADSVSMLGGNDPPSLTVIDTQGVRRTLIARTGDVVARSGDAGRTWSRLPAPALPFASFAGADEGGYAFWLEDDGSGPPQLLGSRVLAGRDLLDPRTAPGPGTAAVMTWDGPVVAYRDEAAGGGRHIALVRRQDARWTSPQPVHLPQPGPARGEPRGGPRIAALRREVAVAWTTETPTPRRRRVLVAFSSDAGRTFGDPVEVDAGRDALAPSGFVDVALDHDGHALVLWQAAAGGDGVTLGLSRVSPDGRRGTPVVLTTQAAERLEGFPQLVRFGDRAAVTWIEGSPGRIRVATVSLAAIPAPDGRPTPVAAAAASTPAAPPARGRVGESVPDLELRALDQARVSTASLRGRAVLLNLWATWCLPCRLEMPELAELHERHAADGLEVIGVSVDGANALDRVQEFVAERQIPFTVWLDPEMRLPDALRIRAYPTTLVIDREGRIVWRRDRAITADDDELGEALRRALSE